MIKKQCPVFKNYLQIISPIPFYLWINDNTTEKVYMPANGYTFDCKKLMLKETMPVQPAYTLWIEYDETILAEGESVQLNASDTNFSDVMQVFGGDVVQLNDAQLTIFRALISEGAQESTLQTIAKESTLQTIAKESTSQVVKSLIENLSQKVLESKIVSFKAQELQDNEIYKFYNLYMNLNLNDHYACIITNVNGQKEYPQLTSSRMKLAIGDGYLKKSGNTLFIYPATTGTYSAYYQGVSSYGLQAAIEVRIETDLLNEWSAYGLVKK